WPALLHPCISVNEGFVVDIADHKVECGVEVDNGRTTRKCGAGQAPVVRHIIKSEVSIISKGIVRQFDFRDLPDNFLFRNPCECFLAIDNEIVISDILGEPISNNDITKAIVVEVGHQWRPAPVCFGNVTHEAYFAENGVPERITFVYAGATIKL